MGVRSKACTDLIEGVWDGKWFKGKATTTTKDGPERSDVGESLISEHASKARIAIIKYMAQDCPEVAVTARVFSQQMASPAEGIEFCRH